MKQQSSISRRAALTSVGMAGLLALAACAGTTGTTPSDNGDSYPEHTIELVVPFAAGGSVDLTARALAAKLEGIWNVSVTVTNQPGGNTLPAVQQMLRSNPDGYTLLMDSQGSSSMLPVAIQGIDIDPTERTSLVTATSTPQIFFVAETSPLRTFEDAVEYMKENPTTFTWTSLGGAGVQDYVFRKLFRALDIDAAGTRAVSLAGGSAAVTEAAGGHVDIGASSWGAIKALYEGGKIRVLAVADDERFYALPDVPTTTEVGLPDVQVSIWIGVSGPAGLPENVISRWEEGVKEALSDKSLQEQFENLGLIANYSSSADASDALSEETDVVRTLWAQ